MWESVCYSLFSIAILGLCVLGYLAFFRKKKQFSFYFLVVALLGFGFGFLGIAPEEGVFPLLIGLALIILSVCLTVFHLRNSTKIAVKNESKNFQAPQTTHKQTKPILPTPTPMPTFVLLHKDTHKNEPKPDLVVPSWKDGCPKCYSYTVNIQLTDKAKLVEQAKVKEFMLEPIMTGDEVHILSGGVDVGKLLDRCDMLKDWLEREDPYFFCIKDLQDDENPLCTGLLVFYRDRRKGQDRREQTVLPLVNYKSSEKQDNILMLHEGEELEIEEDDEQEEKLNVTAGGLLIGKLPAKIARRYAEDGAYGVFFEKSEDEETDSGDCYKPFIRIIW